MLVVDASVAVKWVLDEAGDQEARALIGSGDVLIAPELVVAEVANVAWRRLMKGQIGPAQARLINQEVPRVFSMLVALVPLRSGALRIANDLGHPVYDCFYLALAERENADLVTADRRLIARLAGSPWAATCRPLTS